MKTLFPILLVLCLLGTACKKIGGEYNTNCGNIDIQLTGNQDTDMAELNTRYNEIQEMVADRSAGNASQCHTMAVGDKPCGGPATYIIYSSRSVDESELEDRVCYYTAFNTAINEEYGLVSDCALEAAPAIELRDGTCQAQ